MRSNASQKSWERKCSGEKVQSGCKMVERYPSATSVLGPGWQMRCMAASKQIMGGGRTRARRGPQGLQHLPDAGILSGPPQGSGQAEVAGRGGEGKGSGAL